MSRTAKEIIDSFLKDFKEVQKEFGEAVDSERLMFKNAARGHFNVALRNLQEARECVALGNYMDGHDSSRKRRHGTNSGNESDGS